MQTHSEQIKPLLATKAIIDGYLDAILEQLDTAKGIHNIIDTPIFNEFKTFFKQHVESYKKRLETNIVDLQVVVISAEITKLMHQLTQIPKQDLYDKIILNSPQQAKITCFLVQLHKYVNMANPEDDMFLNCPMVLIWQEIFRFVVHKEGITFPVPLFVPIFKSFEGGLKNKPKFLENFIQLRYLYNSIHTKPDIELIKLFRQKIKKPLTELIEEKLVLPVYDQLCINIFISLLDSENVIQLGKNFSYCEPINEILDILRLLYYDINNIHFMLTNRYNYQQLYTALQFLEENPATIAFKPLWDNVDSTKILFAKPLEDYKNKLTYLCSLLDDKIAHTVEGYIRKNIQLQRFLDECSDEDLYVFIRGKQKYNITKATWLIRLTSKRIPKTH